MEPKISKKHIEQSYISLIGDRNPLPIDKETTPSEWKVRFQYIGCQQYCPVCKKWMICSKVDYCEECGMDFYSHIDVKNGEIAPIRRGWCSRCRINLSLNEQLNCEACYNSRINQNNKADDINNKRKQIKEQIVSSDIHKEIDRIERAYGELITINLCMKGIVSTSESEKQLMAKITPEMLGWATNKETKFLKVDSLWEQLNQRAKELYRTNGICW